MEPIMRRVIKLYRLRNEVLDLASLSPDGLDGVVEKLFQEASLAAPR
jgi:hypothetical protein